jgi:hypothetical protein
LFYYSFTAKCLLMYIYISALKLSVQFFPTNNNFFQHSQISLCKEERLHVMGTNLCKNITQIKIKLQVLKHRQIFSYLVHVIYISFHFKTI